MGEQPGIEVLMETDEFASANSYLASGWRFVGVYVKKTEKPMRYAESHYIEERPVFVLGKAG